MNVFKIAVAAIIAVLFLYIVFAFVQPLFEPKVNLSSVSNGILLDAQNELGKSSTITVTLKEGQTINARNLDSLSRIVSFECSNEENCCSFIKDCKKAVSASPEVLFINEPVKTNLSARCEQKTGIQACTIYIGNTPAQLEWKETTLPDHVLLGQKKTVQGKILNTGETDTQNVVLILELYQKVFSGGLETEEKAFENTLNFDELKSKSFLSFSIPLETAQAGEYTIILKATGEEAGFAQLTGKLKVEGENTSLCSTDKTKTEEGTYDFSIGSCRKKRYCTSCDFAFECKTQWEKLPVTGNSYYDDERGTNEFVYWIYDDINGQC